MDSWQISEEEHQLLLITGTRLVQWADDLAHRAGNRFGPGRIRWDHTMVDDPAETVHALQVLLAETEQELGYLRQTLNGVRERARHGDHQPQSAGASRHR